MGFGTDGAAGSAGVAAEGFGFGRGFGHSAFIIFLIFILLIFGVSCCGGCI
ncbi:MAG: hypothetical protein A4E56_00118 [Pelotomaculum sp. PtaU1.Bin065]|nr:MAG: hypothetical protein A4E56_00118 [Pelotomaculum sp. PtaU1.Bin065]